VNDSGGGGGGNGGSDSPEDTRILPLLIASGSSDAVLVSAANPGVDSTTGKDKVRGFSSGVVRSRNFTGRSLNRLMRCNSPSCSIIPKLKPGFSVIPFLKDPTLIITTTFRPSGKTALASTQAGISPLSSRLAAFTELPDDPRFSTDDLFKPGGER
jgi:hypothetical protein